MWYVGNSKMFGGMHDKGDGNMESGWCLCDGIFLEKNHELKIGPSAHSKFIGNVSVNRKLLNACIGFILLAVKWCITRVLNFHFKDPVPTMWGGNSLALFS